MSMGTFGTLYVYCDMTTADGGWIVIQRNKKRSSFIFDRNWSEYEYGFGRLTNEFWYGLKLMHFLTQTGHWEIRVDYTNRKGYHGPPFYIHYNQFKVGNASEQYKLTIGGYIGGDGDYFNGGDQPVNNRSFSTFDNDNDLSESNCALVAKSGWWFNACDDINPNRQPPLPYKSDSDITEMKIRPKACI